jgi:hypothetical protein
MNHADAAMSWAVFGAVWCLVGVAFGVLVLTGCAAPAILGGATPATTSHPCPGRPPCPNAYDCPPYANPTGPCEAKIWDGPDEAKHRAGKIAICARVVQDSDGGYHAEACDEDAGP